MTDTPAGFNPNCRLCDVDRHICPGCGTHIPHGTYVCEPCSDQPAPPVPVDNNCPACHEGGIEQAHASYPGAVLGDSSHRVYIRDGQPVNLGAVELDATVAAWHQAALAADAQIAYYKEIRARAEEHIQAAMGDATEATIGGRPAVSWKTSAPGKSLDRKALEAVYGADVIKAFERVNKAARPFKVLPLDGE